MYEKRKIVAVFGGTFDPPHLGHLSMLDAAFSAGVVDKAVVVPAARPPHKAAEPAADFEDRLEMARLMGEGVSGKVAVSDIESRLDSDGPTYTFETMAALETEMPGVELRFLIGGDSLVALHTWFKARGIVERWGVVTVPRRGEGDGSEATERVLAENWSPEIASRLLESILPCGMEDVSSSAVRRLLAEGKDASVFLQPAVSAYIKRKGLYKCRK